MPTKYLRAHNKVVKVVPLVWFDLPNRDVDYNVDLEFTGADSEANNAESLESVSMNSESTFYLIYSTYLFGTSNGMYLNPIIL